MPDKDTERQPLMDKGGEGGDRVEITFIQGFRFVAMGWVIVFHYVWFGSVHDQWPGRLILGRPLDLFTVISGFVTQLAYGKRESVGGPFHFLLRRSSKLLVMYYAALLIAWILHIIAAAVQGNSFVDIVLHFVCCILPSLLGLNAWFSALFPLYGGEENIPSWLYLVAKSSYPVNGALWYLQALAFCWFCYPLFRKSLASYYGQGSRLEKCAVILLLWFFSILPALLVQLAPEPQPFAIFLKLFPPFMLPSFVLGVVVCDLYEQEVTEANESAAPGWHESAAFFGEILFVFFVLFIAAVPTDKVLRFHLYCLTFGFVVFFMAVASGSPRAQTFTIGFKKTLESDPFVLLGDLSLAAYTLQSPLSTLFYWVVGPGGIMHPSWIHVHWMGPLTFVVFALSLYAVAAVVRFFVDRPLSKWISGAIAESTQGIKDW